MHCDIGKGDRAVEVTQIVPGLCLWDKVCEAEKEVGEHEHCALVESLNVVGELAVKWFVPSNVDCHAESDKVLRGKLHPDISPEFQNDYNESHSSEEEHDYHDE